MPIATISQLSGPKKAAILTILLGPEKAAEVLTHAGLQQSDIERLAFEIMRLEEVDEETRRALEQEYNQDEGDHPAYSGGTYFLERLLGRVYDTARAADIIKKVRPKRTSPPFSFLSNINAKQLSGLLSEEQPQAVAIILRHLSKKKAGELLSGLPENVRIEAVKRVVKTGEPSEDTIRRMETVLKRKTADLGTGEIRPKEEKVGGARALVEILNYTDLDVETAILESLSQTDPALGNEVRDSMFILEDLPKIERRMLQIALRELDTNDLAMSLKGSTEAVKTVVFENLSENATNALKEELDALGKVRKREVVAAQQKIVAAIREMISDGKISLRRDKDDLDTAEEMYG